MKERYKVLEILEQDFGCEGCPDGQVPMVTVYMQDQKGKKVTVQEKDSVLYKLDIKEGDDIWLEDGVIKK